MGMQILGYVDNCHLLQVGAVVFFFFNLSRRSDSQTKEWAVGVVGSGGLSVNETDVKE